MPSYVRAVDRKADILGEPQFPTIVPESRLVVTPPNKWNSSDGLSINLRVSDEPAYVHAYDTAWEIAVEIHKQERVTETASVEFGEPSCHKRDQSTPLGPSQTMIVTAVVMAPVNADEVQRGIAGEHTAHIRLPHPHRMGPVVASI
jgi:hypothetical protein